MMTPEIPEANHDVVAIDGGAATGKTTSALRVAGRLGFGYIDSGAIYRAVAARRGLPYADMNVEQPSVELLRRLPPALLRRARITPIEDEDGSLLVATSDPDDRQSLDAVCRVLAPGDVVLLKSSRGGRLEEVAAALMRREGTEGN